MKNHATEKTCSMEKGYPAIWSHHFKFPRSFRPRNSEDSRNSSAACTLHRVGTKSLPIGTAGVGAHGPSCCDELGRKDVSRFLFEYDFGVFCFNDMFQSEFVELLLELWCSQRIWTVFLLTGQDFEDTWQKLMGVPSMKGWPQGVLGTT